jgi:thiamine-phosphate pyrophosphorylase
MHSERPILCLVTDRRRLTTHEDGVEAGRLRLAELAREAVDAGIDIIQIREHDLETRALVDLVETIVEVASGSPTRVVVNDRLDVAITSGADGVHLRADSISPTAARSLAPPTFLLGRSVHDVAAAVDSAGSDYLIAGTVFPTASKPSVDRFLGPAGFAKIVRATQIPVLAIGGITVARVRQVAATGAAGVAAIGLFLPSSDSLAAVVGAVRSEFDTVKAAS